MRAKGAGGEHGKDLAGAYPEARALFDRANDALGYDLTQICFEGPEAELTKMKTRSREFSWSVGSPKSFSSHK